MGATSTSYTTPSTMPSMDQYQYRALFTNSQGSTNTNAAILTVQYAPIISIQPMSQTVSVPSSATFTASSIANPSASVQWQLSINGGSSWNNIMGATSTSYTTPSTTSSMDQYQYRATFTNIVGSAVSFAATVTVQYAPIIISNPTSQTVSAGNTVGFTSLCHSNPVANVQWQSSSDSGATWVPIAGASATSFVITIASSSMDNNLYRAMFTNSQGATTSSAAVLTVQYAAVILSQPSTQTVISPAPATFSISLAPAGNPASSVQWYQSVDSGFTWNAISGATANSFTIPTTSLALDQSRYRAVVSNVVQSQISSVAILTVWSLPTITAQPASQAAIVGSVAEFSSMAVSNPSCSIAWSQSSDGGSTWQPIPGAAQAQLDLYINDPSMDTLQVHATFSNPVGSVTSNVAVLSVEYAPVIVAQPPATVVLPLGGSDVVSVVVIANPPVASTQWQVSVDGGVTWVDLTGQTSNSLTLLATTASMDQAQYRVVSSNAVGSTTSWSVLLAVLYAPMITLQPVSAVGVQFGSRVVLSAAAVGNPTPVVQWQTSLDGGSTWASILGATTDRLPMLAFSNTDNTLYHAVFSNSQGTSTSTSAIVQLAASYWSSSSSLDFGLVSGSSAQNLSIVNVGFNGLTVSLAVSLDSWFSIPKGLPISNLSAQHTSLIEVVCTPPRLASSSTVERATLLLSTNDPLNALVAIPLACTASRPQFVSNPPPGSVIDLGVVPAGETASRTIGISNNGTAPLTVLYIPVLMVDVLVLGAPPPPPPPPQWITIESGLPIVDLASSAPATLVTVTCAPPASANVSTVYSTRFEFDSSDPNQGTVAYTFTCEVAAAVVPQPTPSTSPSPSPIASPEPVPVPTLQPAMNVPQPRPSEPPLPSPTPTPTTTTTPGLGTGVIVGLVPATPSPTPQPMPTATLVPPVITQQFATSILTQGYPNSPEAGFTTIVVAKALTNVATIVVPNEIVNNLSVSVAELVLLQEANNKQPGIVKSSVLSISYLVNGVVRGTVSTYLSLSLSLSLLFVCTQEYWYA